MKKILIIILATVVTNVLGQTLEVSPSQDNTLYESTTGNISNGSGLHTFIGKTGNNDGQKLRRTVTKFDVSSIPPGSTIDSVIVRFTVSKVPSGAQAASANLHLMLSDWGEGASDSGSPGGSGAAAQTGDATWVNSFFPNQTWNTTGGDFRPTSSHTANYGTSNGESFVFANSLDLIADVQLWVDTPQDNFGWMLIGDENTVKNSRRLFSSESSIASGAPTIIIDYTLMTNDQIFANGFE